MATIPSQIHFCFLVLWRLAFRKAKNYLHTKIQPDISIHGRDITTSGFWKQTSAILKFYSRFRFWLFHCHRHVILHWPTKLYANGINADGVMTLYWFYKMAAILSQIYFRFMIRPRLTFRKVQSCRHTKFRPDISIHGRYITTSGFWKQTSAHIEILPPFWFWPFYCHRHRVLHRHTKFHRNRSSASELWRQYDVIAIFKMAAVSHARFGVG